jgi:hypothetical protein
LPSVRLPPDPPLGQLRATPTESDVSAESCVGNRVRTSTSALIPHPTGRDTPPLSELLGGQNFKERTLCWCVLCSELCSSGFHRFPFKELQCMAVRRTAVHALKPVLCVTYLRPCAVSYLSRVPKPLVPRVMGHFKTPRRGRTPLVRCLPVRFCIVPKLSHNWDSLGRIAIVVPL